MIRIFRKIVKGDDPHKTWGSQSSTKRAYLQTYNAQIRHAFMAQKKYPREAMNIFLFDR